MLAPHDTEAPDLLFKSVPYGDGFSGSVSTSGLAANLIEGQVPGAWSPGVTQAFSWQTKIGFPVMYFEGQGKPGEIAVYDLTAAQAELEKITSWLWKAMASFDPLPDPKWAGLQKVSAASSFAKGKIGQAARAWQFEMRNVEARVNAAFALAHALNRWDWLDEMYPSVHAWLARTEQGFNSQGEWMPVIADFEWPSGLASSRAKWHAAMLSGSFHADWEKRKKERAELGLPMPPSPPFVGYKPWWWIHSSFKGKVQGAWKSDGGFYGIKQVALVPDFDLLPALAQGLLLSIFGGAAVEAVAGGVWGSFGAPAGAEGLTVIEDSLQGGAAAAVKGDNILDGLASGALDSEAIEEVADMTILGDLGEALEPFAEDLSGILDLGQGIKDQFDALTSKPASSVPAAPSGAPMTPEGPAESDAPLGAGLLSKDSGLVPVAIVGGLIAAVIWA